MMPLADNPVFQRELRRRFRGPSFLLGWVLGYSIFFSLLVGGTAIGLYFYYKSGNSPTSGTTQVGQYLIMVMFLFQRWFFFFTVPGFAAVAITSEKEKKTLHMTLLTAMTPADIMLGKLVGLFLFVVTLIISSIPITMMTFEFGNVTFWMFIKYYGGLLLGVLYYAGCGIGASGMCEKTVSSVLVTYALLTGFFVASFIVPFFLNIANTINSTPFLQSLTEIYPWIILAIKVVAGLGLLWFGYHKLQTYELVG